MVVGRLLGSALAVAAAAAAAHGIQEAAVLVTRQAHRQVKEIMAVLALDLDRVQLMKAAVEVAQRQLVQTLLLVQAQVLAALALRHRLRLAV